MKHYAKYSIRNDARQWTDSLTPLFDTREELLAHLRDGD
jgi:hypothetical protein